MGFHHQPATFISHVNLKVANLQRSLQFYQEIIGFDILEQTSTTAKLTADGVTNLLSLEQPVDVIPKQNGTTGMYHFALLLPEVSDLANIVVHLREKGVRFGAFDHLVSEALYLQDPDGNEIEIYRDRDPSEWEWKGEELALAISPLNFERLLTHRVAGESWSGLPKGTLMGHINLNVSELTKTEQFYVQGLGFDVVNRSGKQALLLSTSNYHHHISVNTKSDSVGRRIKKVILEII